MLSALRHQGQVKVALSGLAEASIVLALVPALVPDPSQISDDYLSEIESCLAQVRDWYAYAQTVLQQEDATYGLLQTIYVAWAPGQEAGLLGLDFDVSMDPAGRGMQLRLAPLTLVDYGTRADLRQALFGGD